MVRNLLNGALSGALATVAMSAVMLAGEQAGLMREHPPKHITRAILPGHRHRPKRGEKPLSLLAHFGFGTSAGALFGILCREREPGIPLGLGYGLAIWIASYEGWVPSMGILPPISQDEPGRPAVMAAGHLVYGTTLVLMNRLLRPSTQHP
ncbi:DUF6789 family protein [Microtetraspora malaysiensis]|uniref:DUF6789 family protein n=1 Tax=Microtetraspora malaysiensis TaxID=161358 RepID=UPI003D8AFED5